jgi:dihydroxyacetone kinase-like protein
MFFKTDVVPEMIQQADEMLKQNSEEIIALDQAIGDGDHLFNLQRGLAALKEQNADWAQWDWPKAWQKIGMTLMSTVGGASGSLYGTLFIAMAKAGAEQPLALSSFGEIFACGVAAVKQRGKAEKGEKTLLDVLIPVADYLQTLSPDVELAVSLPALNAIASEGMEATRDMIATKGRASFLGERSKGHIDAGAKTAQLIISAVVAVLNKQEAQAS